MPIYKAKVYKVGPNWFVEWVDPIYRKAGAPKIRVTKIGSADNSWRVAVDYGISKYSVG